MIVPYWSGYLGEHGNHILHEGFLGKCDFGKDVKYKIFIFVVPHFYISVQSVSIYFVTTKLNMFHEKRN